jgi:hypothetical protein
VNCGADCYVAEGADSPFFYCMQRTSGNPSIIPPNIVFAKI